MPRTPAIALTVASFAALIVNAVAPTMAQTKPTAPDFVQHMVQCNLQYGFLILYAQGTPPPSLPQPANYRALAESVAGKDAVNTMVGDKKRWDTALEAVITQLPQAPIPEGMSEADQDKLIYSEWAKIIQQCNTAAAKYKPLVAKP